jgi:hypothetical protein
MHLRSVLLILLLGGCAASASQAVAPQSHPAPQDARRSTDASVGPSNNTASCEAACAALAGNGNSVSGEYGFIGGGDSNVATGEWDVIAGGRQNNASGDAATIAGGGLNVASGYVSTIGGGSHQQASGYKSTIAGGTENTADGTNSTVGGGISNGAHGADGVVAGGSTNIVSGQYGTVSGGGLNTAAASGTVAGGYENTAGSAASVLGGSGNSANGQYAVALGGYGNAAAGRFALAGGYQSQAAYDGDFVWSDAETGGTKVVATAANQFLVRASGGVKLYSNSSLSTGVTLSPGSGTWASSSDRRQKKDVVALDDRKILAKVAALPVSAWSYRSEGRVRHIGPMAQDFHAAFGLGTDDTHITSIDEDGVALAAIKALHAEVEQQRVELRRLTGEVSSLRKANVRR